MQEKRVSKAKLVALDGSIEEIQVPIVVQDGSIFAPIDITINDRLYKLNKEKETNGFVEYNEVDRPLAKVIPFRKDLH